MTESVEKHHHPGHRAVKIVAGDSSGDYSIIAAEALDPG